MKEFLRGLASIFDLAGVFGPNYEDLQMLRRQWKKQDAEWAKLWNRLESEREMLSILEQAGIFLSWVPLPTASEILQSTKKQELVRLSLASLFNSEMQTQSRWDRSSIHVIWRPAFGRHEVELFETGSLIIKWDTTQGPIPVDLVGTVKLHLGAADM